MKRIKLGIFGPSGRMGQDILKQYSGFKDFTLACLCEKKGHPSINKTVDNIEITSNIETLINSSDVIIDFTSPKAFLNLLEKIKKIDKRRQLFREPQDTIKKKKKNFLKFQKT